MAHERRTTLYTGRVQGVGFRWTTLRALEGLDLGGYVRNLPDGSVELVLEGAAPEIDAGLERVRSMMGANISRESSKSTPATGEFRGLEIRRG